MNQKTQQTNPRNSKLEMLPLLLTRSEFIADYEPAINAMNPFSLCGGMLYADDGADFNTVCASAPEHTWTLRLTTDQVVLISSGFILKDALGHFITRVPHDPLRVIEVVLNPVRMFTVLQRTHNLWGFDDLNDLSPGMSGALAAWHEGIKVANMAWGGAGVPGSPESSRLSSRLAMVGCDNLYDASSALGLSSEDWASRCKA